jgi:hypothetical protein
MIDNVVQFGQAQRVTVLPVPEGEVANYIDSGLELLAPAVRRVDQNVNLEDVREDIMAGTSILWLVYVGDKLTAAITTCVVKHPQRKNLKIEFMGGKYMHIWMDEAVRVLAGLALDANLDAVEADGRKGFEKYVKGSTFRPIYTHYEMEIR